MENKKQLTKEEEDLMELGFLNAVGAIYCKLDANERGEFKKMAEKAIGADNVDAAIKEISNNSSVNGACPPDCIWVRGVGCVC